MFSTNSASGDEPYLPDGYFRFIPIYSGTAQQGQTAKWAAPCFKETTATVSSSDATGATIVLEATEPTSLLCSDFYVILTVEGFHIQSINTHGKHEINWKFNKNSTAAEIAWVAKHGFRVFRFMDHPAKLMGDVASTLELFYPVIHQSPSVAEFSAKANTKFLKDYANVTMEPREKDLLDIDESEFQDGDFLGIIRLDGLDTMQVFGTGAHTGHTAMFMHLDGVLHVVESTDKTAYWPNPNIQRTPWSEWKVLAHKADYNVRHLPLSKEARAKFNVTAAKEFFATVEGMPYGYHNFIWGWVDTPNDNWPWPLSTELAEVAFALVARLEPAIADRMWELAFNKRLGTTNLTTMELYTYLDDHKMTFGQLISIPEQDKWVYPDGLSMVCDVFVCAMYKAGGLFGDLADDIQCTEFQNWDVETLAFFDTAPTLPSACAEADPMLPTCQLMGKYRLRLPGFGTVTPYPHMREKCGAVPPEFVRQKGC